MGHSLGPAHRFCSASPTPTCWRRNKVFAVSQYQKLFTSFFRIYNLGHIFITIALAIFVTALGRSIKTVET